MVDYSKWDALELSDDSDIEVHPNVDKRSFIRAKQNQIHIERQKRKLQIKGLNYEHVINNKLLRRVSDLLQSLKTAGPQSYTRDPIEVAFEINMASAKDEAFHTCNCRAFKVNAEKGLRPAVVQLRRVC